MYEIYFRFYGELNDLLPEKLRQHEFRIKITARASIKDAVEARGVPHTEVTLLLLNGNVSGWEKVLESGDRISAFPNGYNLDLEKISPIFSHPAQPIRFALDIHLRKLAYYLRMLGFDTYYRNEEISESDLVAISINEGRVILTMGRKLLMRKNLKYGRVVRNNIPRLQVVEILKRYKCIDMIKPFTRCMLCNVWLEVVQGEDVEDIIPERVWQRYLAERFKFRRCDGCKRVYWQGTHFDSMQSLIEEWKLYCI
ncbi:MAG: Mut7-C RNAse domain-containing protein [Candidatus Electryonea clarkiae]|nr:Mut7-C RNAse domain-containing protein [Candidatus Electryonea clarkiae]MDP8285119.1 Mut7-C RNAse domain-containing protein [Candidatus Electryonea clarkiae]